MYSDVKFNRYGFAKQFTDDSTTTDLLSLTDFAAGVIQEHLNGGGKGKSVTQKKQVVEWLTRESNYLMKYNFIINKSEKKDSWDVGLIDLKSQNNK